MDLDELLTDIETGFNIAGSIPFVSVFSASLRATAGTIQLIAGIVLGVQAEKFKNSKEGKALSERGVIQLKHGALNIGRAIIEGFLGHRFIGSLFLLAGQLLSPNRFAPIVKYNDRTPLKAYFNFS